jgi:hypothetical protein
VIGGSPARAETAERMLCKSSGCTVALGRRNRSKLRTHAQKPRIPHHAAGSTSSMAYVLQKSGARSSPKLDGETQ